VEIPLDHNFPTPILDCLQNFIPDVTLLPLRRIEPALADLDDRNLVIALHQLGYKGFVTSNYKMLQNPRELAAVLKTKLSVFAIEGVGHDPIRATGALLLDLPSVVSAVEAGGSRGVFWLRPRKPGPQDPWDLFKRIANNRSEDAADLYSAVRVSDEELADPKI
jgi:hypothetical protein